ncbi:MAG: hypothetical protein KF768_08410 [Phycisphaeraceae bacterium]|nr:hypothetical protein [Phycisphaeraceae bacterium]
MCFFITIAVPDHAADQTRAAHAQHGLAIDPTANPSARAAAGDGRTPLLVTGGGCSCAWYKRPSAADAEAAAERAARKYRRLRWSQDKIDRALEAMRPKPRPDDGLHPVVVQLLTALAARLGSVRVWVHDFTGKVESQSYSIARQERWTLAELPARAASLDTDTLVEIVA